jgi:hypothetical protein
VQSLAQVLARRKLTPGAIEFEDLRIVAHSPNLVPVPQEMSEWDASRWSSGRQLLGKSARAGDFIEVEIPAPDNQPRQIVLHATQASDYANLRFLVNGQASQAQFESYAAQVQPGPPKYLGVFAPREGKFILRVEVSGADAKAQNAGAYFGLDYLELKAP